MTDLINYLIFWMKHHPIPVGVVVVAFVVATWLLNRRSQIDREAERVVRNLIDGSKDKYKDTRPLR